MSPPRQIFKFAALSALYFALLTIPWPGPWSGPAPYLMSAYRWLFRGAGNTLFVRMGDGGSVALSPLGSALHESDTTLRVSNSRTGASGSGEIKSIYIGYRPTAFLAALILATPAPWRRRGFAMLWGLLLVGVFVTARTWVRLAVMMSNDDPLRAYDLSDWTRGLLAGVNGVLVRSPAVGYIVPALIWIIVAIRKEQWAKFGIRLGSDEEDGPPVPPRTNRKTREP